MDLRTEKRRIAPTAALLLILASLAVSLPVAEAQLSVRLDVTRVYWGQAGAGPTEAHPGDTNIPLTVEVFNNSSESIRGVKGLLMFRAPFTDPYGNYNTTVSATPFEQSIVSRNETILPLASFTFTYSLTIDAKAEPGSYSFDLRVTYSIKRGSFYFQGSPQVLSVKLIVDKTPTTMTFTVSPQRVDKGGAIDASGNMTPSQENATVLLNLKNPAHKAMNVSVQTKLDGSYRLSFKPDMVGTWSVNASWDGDKFYDGSWAVATFEVTEKAKITVRPSGNYLTADKWVSIDLNLTNTGGIPLSIINVGLTVPQPLLLDGDSSWSIPYMDQSDSSTISIRLYAPGSATGSTFTATMTLMYSDTMGGSYTQTFALALVVKGFITMISYDRAASPNPVAPGRTVTFSGTLLNKGNVKAMYTNATLLPNPQLMLTSGSTSYLGQIDVNSPVPFTLTTNVNAEVGNGTYHAKVQITYQDDQQIEHILEVRIDFTVVKPSAPANPAPSQDLLAFLRELWWMMTIVGGTTVAVLTLYWRRVARIRRTQ